MCQGEIKSIVWENSLCLSYISTGLTTQENPTSLVRRVCHVRICSKNIEHLIIYFLKIVISET